MTSRIVAGLCALVIAAGCQASVPTPSVPAPATLAFHAESAGLVEGGELGFSGAVDLGFEVKSCCGVALYGSRSGLDGDDAVRDRVTEILDGGLELGVVVPALENRFRLRVRGGKSGTPPKRPLLGRTGYSGSGTLHFRVLGVTPPAVAQAAGDVDLFVGYSAWSLGQERSTAGFQSAHRGEKNDFWRGSAFVFGVRVGADYGVNFE